MGSIGLLLYVLADKEPRPGEHEAFTKPLWKQGIGATIQLYIWLRCRFAALRRALERPYSVCSTSDRHCVMLSDVERNQVASYGLSGSSLRASLWRLLHLAQSPSAVQIEESGMYHHVKKVMYSVNIGKPHPWFGNMLLERSVAPMAS